MLRNLGSYRSWKSLLASAVIAALTAPGLQAQTTTAVPDPVSADALVKLAPSAPACQNPYGSPNCPAPYPPPGFPNYFPNAAPGTPGTPGGPSTPNEQGTPNGTGSAADSSGNSTNQGLGDAFAGGAGGGGQGGLESAGGTAGSANAFAGAGNGGYVDTAIPLTQYRLRVDAANGDNRPDRADYFYPKCGCFRFAPAPFTDPNAPGPGKTTATNVDFQELHNYLEIAVNPRFSGWVDIPIRWVDISFANSGEQTQYNSGLSDIQFGFKAALIYKPTQVVTFQLRTYAPSGNASLGLGRNNWNLEPGLLYYQRLAPRLFFEGEIMDFIPVASADDFAGNVLQYGGALSYLIYNQPNFRISPVGEIVGWNVLSGKELSDAGPVSAVGDTIINAKAGLRIGFGRLVQPGFINRTDVYVGYGRALTGEVWYKNMARAEFRFRF